MTTTNESNNGHDHTAPENAGAFDQDAYPTHGGSEPAPAADLSDFDEDYAEAEAPEFDEVPDGRYQVRVHTVKLARSQKNDPMIKWDTVIISGGSGGHAGRHIFKNSVITQSSLPYVKADLQTLGLALEKFSDLPNHLDALLDLTIDVTKRTKGEYANVYFNKLLNIPPGSPGSPGRPGSPGLGDGPAGGRIDLSNEPAPF